MVPSTTFLMCTHRHNHKFNKTRNTYKLSIFDGRLRFQNPVGLIVNRCHGSSHCHCRPSLQSLSRDTFSIGVPHYSRCHGSSHVHCCPSLQVLLVGHDTYQPRGPGFQSSLTRLATSSNRCCQWKRRRKSMKKK